MSYDWKPELEGLDESTITEEGRNIWGRLPGPDVSGLSSLGHDLVMSLVPDCSDRFFKLNTTKVSTMISISRYAMQVSPQNGITDSMYR